MTGKAELLVNTPAGLRALDKEDQGHAHGANEAPGANGCEPGNAHGKISMAGEDDGAGPSACEPYAANEPAQLGARGLHIIVVIAQKRGHVVVNVKQPACANGEEGGSSQDER